MYQPKPPPNNVEDLARSLWEELRSIAVAINQPLVEYQQFKALTAAPSKPRVGCIYLADCVNWDPLSVTGSNAYFVWYTGSAYRGLHETAGGTNLT